MKFKLEDKVRFRDERGEGIVTGLIPPDRVRILMEGIEIPVYCKELIKVVFEHEAHPPADPARLLFEKKDISSGKKAPGRKRKGEKFEVDLHIGNLVEKVKGMSNGEMLNIQLNHFQYWMERAIRENIERIVFIHGIGNGVLKHELRRMLGNYPGVTFFDAAYSRYGFGATEVQIR